MPYYSRYQIEAERVLEGKDRDGVAVGPPTWLFFRIQESGRLRLPDGRDLLVHYQASNGRPYRSIGRYMIERGFLVREEMSMQAIRKYLTENPAVLDEVLNHNPSFVFFRQVENGPSGSLAASPDHREGRVALDSRIFPKGALRFMSCQKPTVTDQGGYYRLDPILSFCPKPGHRRGDQRSRKTDIFWGAHAELTAGHLQHDGDLVHLDQEVTCQLIMIKRHLLEAEQKGFWYASGKESQILPQEVPYELCCGMDLHSSNTVIGIIDEKRKHVIDRKVPNDPELIWFSQALPVRLERDCCGIDL